ncbi:hypothetical protein [Bradyrhizobium sp.]|uniref:hypothetical protein n=1 Tax=Bradyrhizobium sp. TaxID=376 RepID=UPI001D392902|nr:hypothetical protein [Bradyrhizobium sp.]MBI5323559.1 hypothetical protein [Bradyrhizobium sp.]
MVGTKTGAWLGLLMAVGLPALDANAAPKQLYGKSVVVGWTEQVTQKRSDGAASNPTIVRERLVYVSGAGRVFVKGRNSINNPRYSGRKDFERGPGEGASEGTPNFQGDRLVGTGVYSGFARRLVVTFDPSFTSCSASVVYGRSGGPSVWKDMNDSRITYEVQSINVGGTTCSVREGNAVAN